MSARERERLKKSQYGKCRFVVEAGGWKPAHVLPVSERGWNTAKRLAIRKAGRHAGETSWGGHRVGSITSVSLVCPGKNKNSLPKEISLLDCNRKGCSTRTAAGNVSRWYSRKAIAGLGGKRRKR